MSVQGVSSTGGAQGTGEMRSMHGPRKLSDKTVSALADKLGLSADDLKSKLEEADDPRKALDQLAEERGVSRHELRETIRATMPARTEKGGESGPPPPLPGGPGGVSFDDEAGQKLLEALADKLGTSADELKSKLDNGEDLKDILDSSGLSHEDIRAAVEEAFKSWQSYGSTGASATTSTPEYNAVDVQV